MYLDKYLEAIKMLQEYLATHNSTGTCIYRIFIPSGAASIVFDCGIPDEKFVYDYNKQRLELWVFENNWPIKRHILVAS